MLLELGRCAEWADLFFPDGILRCAGAHGQAPVEFKGRTELLSLGKRLMRGELDIAAGNLAPPLRCRQVLSNITLFEQQARHASGYAFVNVTTIGGREAPRWLASGRYSDQLFKCAAGCWRFERRVFVGDGALKAAGGADQPLSTAEAVTVA